MGSSRFHPVNPTAATPISTPPDVHTSVIKCRASDSSVTDWNRFPAWERLKETPRFTIEATREIPRPSPTWASGRGGKECFDSGNSYAEGCNQYQRPLCSARKITPPCCIRRRAPPSAGLAAIVSIARAMVAAARLTIPSMPSESSPTEPVRKYAPPFSVILTMAAVDGEPCVALQGSAILKE